MQLNDLEQACLALPRDQPGVPVHVLSDDKKTSRGECGLVFGNSLGPEFRDQSAPLILSPEDTKAYLITMREGDRIKSQRKLPYAEMAFYSFISGLYAFVGGLAVWVFYRLVCFAIKG